MLRLLCCWDAFKVPEFIGSICFILESCSWVQKAIRIEPRSTSPCFTWAAFCPFINSSGRVRGYIHKLSEVPHYCYIDLQKESVRILTPFLSSLHCSDKICSGTSCTFGAKNGWEFENGRLCNTGIIWTRGLHTFT